MADPDLDPRTEEKAKNSRKDEEVEVKLPNSFLLAQHQLVLYEVCNFFLQLRDTFLFMSLN